MAHAPVKCYVRWFEYEKDSHAAVMRSLTSVPDDLRSDPQYGKAVQLMAHIVEARRLWLFRLGLAKKPPTNFFPENVQLEDLTRRIGEMQSVWSGYLSGLSDERLELRFEYKSTEGDWYQNTIADILTQLFGHSVYHRGQIALLLRSMGAVPAETDFVFWTRELIPDRHN